MKTKIILLIFSILTSLTLQAEIPEKSKLQQAMEVIDAICPVPAGDVGAIVAAKYKPGHVVIKMDLNETIIALDKMPDAPESMKQTAMTTLQNMSGNKNLFFDLLIEEGADISFIYTGKKSGKSITILFTNDDIRSISSVKAENKDPLKALRAQLEISRKLLPMELDKGLVCTSQKLVGQNVVHYINVDENLYDVDLLNQHKADMKAEMTGMVKGGDLILVQFARICREAGIGIVYKYVGNISGKECVLVLKPSDF